jgi:hypothetical protein
LRNGSGTNKLSEFFNLGVSERLARIHGQNGQDFAATAAICEMAFPARRIGRIKMMVGIGG